MHPPVAAAAEVDDFSADPDGACVLGDDALERGDHVIHVEHA